MARKDRTFSSDDLLRVWAHNLEFSEQIEVVDFFAGTGRSASSAFFPLTQAFRQIDVAQSIMLSAINLIPSVPKVFVTLITVLFDIRDTIERISDELTRLQRGALRIEEVSKITRILLDLV